MVSSKKVVLVIEDSESNMKLLHDLLDLGGHLLLDLEPTRIDIYDAGEFADTENPLIRDVANMGLPMIGAMWCSQ